jgi:hypothetical protein
MAAAAIGPVQGPETLRWRTALNQEITGLIENEQRERAMQHTAALVTQRLAQEAEVTVGFVDQNQGVGIGRHGARQGSVSASLGASDPERATARSTRSAT